MSGDQERTKGARRDTRWEMREVPKLKLSALFLQRGQSAGAQASSPGTTLLRDGLMTLEGWLPKIPGTLAEGEATLLWVDRDVGRNTPYLGGESQEGMSGGVPQPLLCFGNLSRSGNSSLLAPEEAAKGRQRFLFLHSLPLNEGMLTTVSLAVLAAPRRTTRQTGGTLRVALC